MTNIVRDYQTDFFKNPYFDSSLEQSNPYLIAVPNYNDSYQSRERCNISTEQSILQYDKKSIMH